MAIDKEEYKKLLDFAVSNQQITQEYADKMLASFDEMDGSAITQGMMTAEPSNTFLFGENEQSIVTQPPIQQKSFLQTLIEEDNNAVNSFLQEGTEIPSHDILRNRASIGRDYPVTSLSIEELMAENSPEALEELKNREDIQQMSFMETLSDPRSLERYAASVPRAVLQMSQMPQAIKAFGTKGLDMITPFDMGGDQALQEFGEGYMRAERALGTSPAITAGESVIESLTGALVPGGFFTKAGGVALDFFVDQSVREISDDVGEKYQTVFDNVGITSNEEKPLVSPLIAVGIGLLGGSLTASAINKLVTTRLPRSITLREITELDPNAPKGLKTLETASDVTKTYVVDEQQVLRDLLRRNGIANADEIDARIEFDTHTAARTRIGEAVATGKLSTHNATFNSPVAPKVLYDAYNNLDPKNREAVARYINLLDVKDDVNIAITQNKATIADLLPIDQELNGLRNSTPMVVEFSKRYNSVTEALRSFGEGSLFSSSYKKHLDTTRSNYVTLELSSVDPSAPFKQRLAQSQINESGIASPEWFMQNRAIGNFSADNRADPFDMLLKSVDGTLSARMKNDTNVAIIDALLASPIGQQTMRLASEDDLAKGIGRTVSVYRNGKEVKYVTSRLTASLMKFDPYIAKHPLMFIPKRIFETAAVGPLSITFAPVTAIRDALGGRVTRPDSLLAANPMEVLKAIPEQVWAKAQKAISSNLEQSFVQGNTPFPTSIMSAAKQRALADNIADSYTRTLYHQATNSGGFDASLMKSNIKLGQGMLAEVARTLDRQTRNINIPGAKFSSDRIRNMIKGFTEIFNAIQDAPRYAAIKKTVDAGMNIDEATGLGRQLTGDVSKSGRVYDPQGQLIRGDVVDQGFLNVANPTIGKVTEVVRESTPFVNPMIQGNRRLLQSIVDNPIQFNIRAWTNIGVPAMAMYGWNEMLGKEYNDYAMQGRSARDVVMNMYLGIPGLPPEKGIEIPIMHELLSFSAPFTRALYGISRGEGSEKTGGALSVISESILSNSLEIGFPTTGKMIANLVGVNAPDSIMRPSAGVYEIREDELGVLPENIEKLARTLFAGIGDTAMHVANALSDDPSFETLYSQLRKQVLEDTPLIKGPLGYKKANTQFSIPSAMIQKKSDAMDRFRNYWDAYYNPERMTETVEIQNPSSKKDFINFKHELGLSEDMPKRMIGPENLGKVLNPMYEKFGLLLVNKGMRGNENMTALIERERVYGKFIKRLNSYNNGNKDALAEWQAIVSGIEPLTDNTRKLKELLVDEDLDLTSYADRIRLINLIESKRTELLNAQSDVYERLEAEISEELKKEGLDVKFDITKHLDPFDADPFRK